MPKLLAAECRTLKKNLPRLLETARDRFVLIHGAMIVGTYETEGDALREGYARFGPQGVFLIDEVGAEERPWAVTYLLRRQD